ncbi:MAG TPA: flagellar assembly peptidoglycan hydrolase FlgJ [Steroidobacteraceae bacterium]|nr:flagellar assembly peptidoglycan hydrolase FlgJ [Steroidobacteraceae bacterium]
MTTPIKFTAPPMATTNANTYSDLNGLAALKKDPNSPQALHAVAQQVDALFLQMMLKSMRDASAAAGESGSNEMGMYQDMFDKQIALTMSQHQGLGLGALLTRQLGATTSPAAAAPDAGGATTSPAVPTPYSRGGATPPPAVPTTMPTSALPATSTQSASEFVDQVLPSIRTAAQALGLNPLAMLAQAALETGWGKRMARTAGGAPSLNLFGIKADDSWDGARATATTVEYSGGVAQQRHAAFRAYGSIEESVNDFANLLKNSPRFARAAAAGQDAQAYIASIGQSGYATDPDYANKLNEILNSSTLREAVSTKL